MDTRARYLCLDAAPQCAAWCTDVQGLCCRAETVSDAEATLAQEANPGSGHPFHGVHGTTRRLAHTQHRSSGVLMPRFYYGQ